MFIAPDFSMPKPLDLDEFRRRQQPMKCPACKALNWRSFAQVMASDKFKCERCDRVLPFDKEGWLESNFKPKD